MTIFIVFERIPYAGTRFVKAYAHKHAADLMKAKCRDIRMFGDADWEGEFFVEQHLVDESSPVREWVF